MSEELLYDFRKFYQFSKEHFNPHIVWNRWPEYLVESLPEDFDDTVHTFGEDYVSDVAKLVWLRHTGMNFHLSGLVMEEVFKERVRDPKERRRLKLIGKRLAERFRETDGKLNQNDMKEILEDIDFVLGR